MPFMLSHAKLKDSLSKNILNYPLNILLILFGIESIIGIFSHRSLIADGCCFFISVLETENTYQIIEHRNYAYFWLEWPTVLAIKLGLTNFFTLSLLFGALRFLQFPLSIFLSTL
jgi:hypothetical protein